MSYVCAYGWWKGDEDLVREYKVFETYQEVIDWKIEVNSRPHKVEYWNVSMMLESHEPTKLVGEDLYQGRNEKGMWFDNLVRMMPKNLTNTEICATIMSIACQYWDDEDMVMGLSFLSDSAQNLVDERLKYYEH